MRRMADMLRRFITSPRLALALRLYLGGVFIYASLYKINYAGEFAETIASYQLVPYWGVNGLAVFMPWLEFIAGSLLVVGIRSKAAAGIIVGLLVVFTIAIGSALARDLPMGCGCFHSLEEPMDWTTLVRDIVWLAMSIQVYCCDSLLQLERHLVAGLRRRMPA